MKRQVLHTVWCNISGEAAGGIWNWSLLEVKVSSKMSDSRIIRVRWARKTGSRYHTGNIGRTMSWTITDRWPWIDSRPMIDSSTGSRSIIDPLSSDCRSIMIRKIFLRSGAPEKHSTFGFNACSFACFDLVFAWTSIFCFSYVWLRNEGHIITADSGFVTKWQLVFTDLLAIACYYINR